MVAEAASKRPKMTKIMSSEDEVARLTIEVHVGGVCVCGGGVEWKCIFPKGLVLSRVIPCFYTVCLAYC